MTITWYARAKERENNIQNMFCDRMTQLAADYQDRSEVLMFVYRAPFRLQPLLPPSSRSSPRNEIRRRFIWLCRNYFHVFSEFWYASVAMLAFDTGKR